MTILGPASCQGCRRSVSWNGVAWLDTEGVHRCSTFAPIALPCECGVAVIQKAPGGKGIFEAVRRHNATVWHKKWRAA